MQVVKQTLSLIFNQSFWLRGNFHQPFVGCRGKTQCVPSGDLLFQLLSAVCVTVTMLEYIVETDKN